MSLPKPIESRQRRELPKVLDGNSCISEIPPAPSGISEELLEAWGGVWRSPVAALLDPVSDLPALTRLFRLYSVEERLDRVISHPRAADEFADMMRTALASRLRVAGEILKLEDRLGLSPRSRLALGVALMAGKKAGLSSLDDFIDDSADGDD